jgi:hypothetical protein
MKLFDLFSRTTKSAESVILIDIGTTTIAGAYVYYKEGELPTILYAQSVEIETRSDESVEPAMVRALKSLGDTLIREGAPVLARTTGSGRASLILVSIDAPWQETTIRTEKFEETEPFVFTQNLVSKRLKETAPESAGATLIDESIIGTILNGYETRSPYGKRVRRATVLVLASSIEKKVATGIVITLERIFHTKNILPITGNSLRYQAMRKIFPHERGALILDATNEELSSLSLIRHGLIVSLIQTKAPVRTDVWVPNIVRELTELSKQYPLPRTIFLLARGAQRESLEEQLSAVDFGTLWLSGNRPQIVALVNNHIAPFVRQSADKPVDSVLLLMAIYYQEARDKNEKF